MEGKVRIVQGDITRQEVDAVVNAANTSLRGGGGVDGAIHRAAGPELLKECIQIGGCPTGEARVTGGYNLPARYVIHTVGPVWRGGGKNEDNLLSACYRNCFKAAVELGIESMAFPSISTGAYGFPLERATGIALKETKNFLETPSGLKKVVFVCFGDEAYRTYQDIYKEVFHRTAG